MAHTKGHDILPPPNWPEGITYLTKPRLSPTFPPQLIPLVSPNANTNSKTFNIRPIKHPSNVHIKCIDQDGHPAKGQCGLYAKSKIKGGELIIPYIGMIHSTIIPDDLDQVLPEPEDEDEHSSSDYDLSLLRLSSSDIRNPFPGMHVSIGIDAAKMGNAARFVNDYRGLPGITGPNAEFRLGSGESGELRMEIWSLKCGVGKGEEIRVSYGKGWWGARKG